MTTYNRIAFGQLTTIAESLGAPEGFQELLGAQRVLFGDWGNQEVPVRAPYPSDICDDHSCFEYSVVFNQHGFSIRLLVEAQANAPSLKANQQAAVHLQEKLARLYGIDTSRFDLVKDLFLPREPAGIFTLWHAVGCSPGSRNLQFKAYLNPQCRGPREAPALIVEALSRLGLGRKARQFVEAATPRGEPLDRFSFFSVDLTDQRSARVKVYARYRDVTAAQIESMFAQARSHRPGDAAAYCLDVAGHEGPFVAKPLTACFSFSGAAEAPTASTLHFPISHYQADPRTAAAKVREYLHSQRLDVRSYDRLLEAYGSGVSTGASFLTYASIRRERDHMQLTLYLTPGVFAPATACAARA